MKNEWFGQAPYGYTVMSDVKGNRKMNTRLVENSDEQKVLSLIKQLRTKGKTPSEIAMHLNENRVPTRLKRKGNTCIWHASTVRNILIRPEVSLDKGKKI